MLLPIALASLLYASMLALVLVWTGWSVKKHGWCRRSLRRFSYLIFLMLLAVRLAWCGVLFAYLAERPNLQMHALRSTTAVALDHAAFILHARYVSMRLGRLDDDDDERPLAPAGRAALADHLLPHWRRIHRRQRAQRPRRRRHAVTALPGRAG